jgi:hypothetical protein
VEVTADGPGIDQVTQPARLAEHIVGTTEPNGTFMMILSDILPRIRGNLTDRDRTPATVAHGKVRVSSKLGEALVSA